MRGLIQVIKSSVVMALFFVLATFAAAQEPNADVKFPTSELTIRSAGGQTHAFTVELATNNEQRAYGLMFRKEMDADHGMLFDFGEARRVTMWMENTILPLDMLFIRQDGIITHIRENAVPFSRDVIDSRHPVNYVLELNAGRTKALGIRVGDKVIGKPLGNGS